MAWGQGRRQQGPYNEKGSAKTDWRETIKLDRSVSERPSWLLTCYGHEREGANDVTGDISPEELRWANMISLRNGATRHNLKIELEGMQRARVEQFQALTRASRPPSLGGPPVSRRPATITNVYWIQDISTSNALPTSNGTTPIQFGQPSRLGGFQPQTQQIAPDQQHQPFNIQSGNIGASQTAFSGGFGGPFGAATSHGQPIFGQQQQDGFGLNRQQPSALNDTQMNTHSNDLHGMAGASQHVLGSGGAMWNTGHTAQQTATPGSNQAVASTISFGPSSYSFPSGAAGPFSPIVTEQQSPNGGSEDPDAEAWKASTFQRGKIPEREPPPAVC